MKEKLEKKNLISVKFRANKIFNKELAMFLKLKNVWVNYKTITSLAQKNVI